jgi:hypothetical protein
MKRAWAWLVLLPTLASADEIVLRGGGRISGVVVEERADAVVIEIGPGRVTLPAARVERVVRGSSALAEFRNRASMIPADDAAGWLSLAAWARDRALDTQAREAYERVLSIDPQNAAANQALGRVQLGQRWVTPEDKYRAEGLVPFEGRWVTPAEADMALRERAARERRDADARIREAEERTREAEARAAEAQRQQGESEGIPWVYTGGGYGGYGYVGDGGYVGGGRPPRNHGDEGAGHPRADRPPRQEPPPRHPPQPRPAPTPAPQARGSSAEHGPDRRHD